MEAIGVEISDVGLIVVAGDPARVQVVDLTSMESPGYALPVKTHLVVGRAALEQARLYPRQVNNRFWSQLSTHALPEKVAATKNHAEMAFAHVKHVHTSLDSPQAAWFVTAPHFLDEAKLGILLGILRELNVPVGGLVSGPVAASKPVSEGASVLHVDVHLHAVEITHLTQDDRLRVQQTHIVPDVGWDEFLEQIGKGMADEFVRATRFDPLHHAASEQQLYGQLLNLLWRSKLEERSTLELTTDRTTRSLTVLPQMLTDRTKEMRDKVLSILLRMVQEDGQVVIQLSHRSVMVPGLVKDIQQQIQVSPVQLPMGAAAQGVLRMRLELKQGGDAGVAFVTSRAVRSESEQPTRSQVDHAVIDDVQLVPTHVLYRDRATPIGTTPLQIGASVGQDGIIMNDIDRDLADAHVSILLEDGVLIVECAGEIKLDGVVVSGKQRVSLGQTIQLTSHVDLLRLIYLEPTHGA